MEQSVSEISPRFTDLQLDLEVFHGPFDLLLELVMREEIDLLEVDLAQIVLAYVAVLEARGDLELEPVTEFVVLVAALLELKSRLMLPVAEGDADAELDLLPEEAADELLARMLEYHRYNRLAGWFVDRFRAHSQYGYRSAALPRGLSRASLEGVGACYDPALLGAALGGLLAEPPPVDTKHIAKPQVTLEQRLQHVRALLLRATHFDFDSALKGADRLTECMTIFALLELYKLGEATWEQEQSFGPIEVRAAGRVKAGAVSLV